MPCLVTSAPDRPPGQQLRAGGPGRSLAEVVLATPGPMDARCNRPPLPTVLRDSKTEMLSDEELHTRVVKRLARHDAAASWSSAEDVLCKLEVYVGTWRVKGRRASDHTDVADEVRESCHVTE